MDDFLTKYRALVARKFVLRAQYWPDASGSEYYFQALLDEVAEVRDEMKEANSVFLEDELGDILRNYYNLLVTLQHEWKISSPEKVFERSFIKYQERVENGLNVADRKETKVKQKKRLEDEHGSL